MKKTFEQWLKAQPVYQHNSMLHVLDLLEDCWKAAQESVNDTSTCDPSICQRSLCMQTNQCHAAYYAFKKREE